MLKGNLIIPKNKQELDELFKPLAERNHEELSNDFIFEGNHDLEYGDLAELCFITDYNIGFNPELFGEDSDHVDEFYIINFDIQKAITNGGDKIGMLNILSADEISLEKEGLRFWFD